MTGSISHGRKERAHQKRDMLLRQRKRKSHLWIARRKLLVCWRNDRYFTGDSPDDYRYIRWTAHALPLLRMAPWILMRASYSVSEDSYEWTVGHTCEALISTLAQLSARVAHPSWAVHLIVRRPELGGFIGRPKPSVARPSISRESRR